MDRRPMTEMSDVENGGMMRGMMRIDAVGDGLVYASPIPKAACGGCSAAKGCGVSSLSGYFSSRSQPLILENNFDGRPGETIEVGLPQAVLNKAAFASYAPPVVGLLLGGGFAGLFGVSDGWAALSAGVGLVFGLLATRLLARRLTGLRPVFLGRSTLAGAACHEG